MMTELKDTTELMCSTSYKDRFVRGYYQLKIRTRNLQNYVDKIQLAKMHGYEEPPHDCPLEMLRDQLFTQNHLLKIFEMRAAIEHINFEEYVNGRC